MNNEKQEWLKSLKVGDEVSYSTRWRGDVITKIKKITPKGWIKTEDGRTFINGYSKLDNWEGIFLYPVTEELKAKLYYIALFNKVSKTNWNEVELDKIEQIAGILGYIKEAEA
ncbi:hypothetical protein [Paenibacillus sp. XY044]|uniref:hypothetical protein n=1 Tax=Paenibacillus sp. XY044 TaxID=2026089 RepID=UPI000B9931E2|nr:hypothetical protein [Paenibacillus sp. XY044]OZB90082.1 hypothetical protein CJP46_35480 [Paenibacillus sp. XY044]